MHTKLWPKAPAREGALGQMSKNFQVYFIHINFFKKPNKKNVQQSQKFILRCYYIFFLFFIVYLPNIFLKKFNDLLLLLWLFEVGACNKLEFSLIIIEIRD